MLGYTPKHARNSTMKEMIEAAISIAKIEETIYALCKEDQILFGCRNKKISVFLDEHNSSKSWKWKWNALLQVS